MSIKINNLCKSYASLGRSFTNKTVFSHLDLELNEGFTCLYGPSGCGKTTLGRIIAGLDKADCGEIKGIIGAPTVLFQESRLLPALSAYENVKCICSSNESAKLGKILLERFLFSSEDLNKLPRELSGGMARRVAIVRAVVFAIERGGNFVLFDEPFAGFDPEIKKVARDIIKEYLSDKTVLIITHDEEERALFGGESVDFSSLTVLNEEI